MTFIDWDPLARAGLFGGLFLVSLFAVLWLWYDSSGKPDPQWTWRMAGSLLVVFTVPAVFIGAANLDASRETLLNIFGFTGIGAAVLSLAAVAAYAFMRQPTSPAVTPAAFAPTAMESDYATYPLPLSPSLTTVAEPTVADRAAGATVAVPGRPAEAYIFVKSGPDQGRQYSLDGVAVIGRREGCTIVLEDRRISGEHAQIKKNEGNYVFTDLQSTNGSFLVVNGREERIRHSQVLVDGDHVRLGQTVVEFVDTRGSKRR